MTTTALHLGVRTDARPVSRTCRKCQVSDDRPVHIIFGGDRDVVVHQTCHTGCASCAHKED